jgi:hypothetical protein
LSFAPEAVETFVERELKLKHPHSLVDQFGDELWEDVSLMNSSNHLQAAQFLRPFPFEPTGEC